LTRKENGEAIARAKTSIPSNFQILVVWNGPQGAFEIEKFRSGSLAVLDALEAVTARGGTTIVGGGDTVSLVQTKVLS
jgi:phosphoglycerate kinase